MNMTPDVKGRVLASWLGPFSFESDRVPKGRVPAVNWWEGKYVFLLCRRCPLVWNAHMAVGQNQWYHFGVGAPPIFEPILVVGLGTIWILTHGHMFV